MRFRRKTWIACWAVLLGWGWITAAPAHASPRSAALQARGLVSFRQQRWDEALALFDRAVKEDPQDAVATYYRGLTRIRRGQRPEGTADLERALQLSPSLPHAALDLGIAYFDAQRYAGARPWLDRARTQGSERHVAAFFLGLTLYRLEDWAGAIEALEEAKADAEVRSSAQYYAGLAYRRRRDESSARERFAAASEDGESEVGRAAKRALSTPRATAPEAAPEASGGTGRPWSVRAGFGVEYDSNVVAGPSKSDAGGVPGISGKSDGRVVLGAGGRYNVLENAYGSLALGYDFSQSIHFSLTDFDLQGHRVQLEAASTPRTVSFGVSAAYDFYALDYRSFLQEGLMTPWVMLAEGDSLATQAYYSLRGRDFLHRPFEDSRDGTNNAVGVRQYGFLDAVSALLSAGLQFDSEDTVGGSGDDFENNGYQADLNAAFPVADWARLQLGYLIRLEDYQFPNSVAPNQVRRHDTEHQFVIAAERDLTETISVSGNYLGVLNDSNISNFRYDRHVLGLGVRLSF